VRIFTQFSGNYFINCHVLQLLRGAMFDYVSSQEIQLLRKLKARGSEVYVTSNQCIRLELLGLITDGPRGIRLTARGLRVAESGFDAKPTSEFEPPVIVRLAD
jgi:hypothetical protein